MKKTVPYGIYQRAALESWLSRMAKKGFLAEEFCAFGRMRFRKESPTTCRYCMEPRPTEETRPDEEALEYYAAAGWEYVCTDPRNEFFLWRSIRPDARDLHSDPVAESFGYQRLRRRYCHRCLWQLVSLPLVIGLMMWMMGESYLPVLDLVTRDTAVYQFLWVAFLFFVLLWTYYRDLRLLGRLVRSLEAGVEVKARRACPVWVGDTVRLGVLLGLTVLLIGTVSRTGWQYQGDLSACSEALPYVPLETLGGAADGDGGAYGEATWLSAATIQYGEGKAKWRRATENGYLVSGSAVLVDGYALRLPLLAVPLARELLRTNPETEFAHFTDDRFSDAWYGAREDSVQVLILCRNGCVLSVEGQVPEDLRLHLDTFAAAMDGFMEEVR